MFLDRIIQHMRFFQIARKLGNISKTNIILTLFLLIKIHLEKSIFFCRTSAAKRTVGLKVVARLQRFCRFFFERLCINCDVYWYASFFRASKKSACSPSAVNEINKTYTTSTVPLLVRNV